MGFAVFEMVYEPIEFNGKSYIGLTKLAFRKQTTIEKWEAADGVPGITQMDTMGRQFAIPQDKLAVFTYRQEGDNYEGFSILRTCYKNFLFKDKLEKIDVMGHERQSVGVLDITVPNAATDDDKRNVRKAAMALRANNQSFIEHPKDWEVQFLDMKAKTMKDIDPAISRHDRQISKNMHTVFLELGAANASGGRAVGEVQMMPFTQSVQAIADFIVSVLQDTVIKTLTDLNFTGRDYPTLTVGRIADDNLPVISEAFAKFHSAGVLHPTPADENRIRKMLGLAEIDEAELEALYNTPEPPVPTTDTHPQTPPEPASDVKPPVEASTLISQVRALRASVEEALYDSRRAA